MMRIPGTLARAWVVLALAAPAAAAGQTILNTSNWATIWASLYETVAFDVAFDSRRLLENITTTIDPKAKDAVKQTGQLPHKVNHQWRFFAGPDALMVRLHFSKFKLGDASLKILNGAGTVVHTFSGNGPADGWTPWISATAVSWKLDTKTVVFADGTYGFAIDKIEVSRFKTSSSNTAMNLGATNREWYGALSPGKDHYFVVNIGQSGRHDFYLEGFGGKSLSFYVASGTTLPQPASTASAWKREGSAVSKVLADKTLSPGTYTILVRNVGATPASYVFMVNRVVAVFDLEIELDGWKLTDAQWAQRRCMIEKMFRIASERLYSATDGYMRYGKVYYFRQSYWNNDVDAVIKPDEVRASAMFYQIGHIKLGANHLNYYAKDCTGTDMTPKRNGGSTFVHEWGHYDFENWDEYRDVDGKSYRLCPHSLMGDSDGRYEYCTAFTHNYNTGNFGWAFSQRDNSCWSDIRSDYGGIPSSIESRSPNPHVFEGTAIGSLVQFRVNLTCNVWPLIGPTGFGPDCE
jgi:hypothetical protein